ncbi:MAG: DUF4442 domain-containing protein [Phycisphaerales bacterium]|nr:DUF4442 domain-containing protein [Phycisphaerales bacterium]
MTTARFDHAGADDAPVDTPAGMLPAKKPLSRRLEAFISRLSTRNNFWHRVCSLIWLPYAFRSGITIRRLDAKSFTAVLPFRRFNRNWYNAMAGAALLGNSEVAGGMFLFAKLGSEYEVICKNMEYKFLRPCYGPAIYEVANADEVDLSQHVKDGDEFNVELQLRIRQQVGRKGTDRHVGRCVITFHCTPKDLARDLRARRRSRAKSRGN